MKQVRLIALVSLLLTLSIFSVLNAATYTWNGATTAWTTATNWTPTRTTPATSDILQFNSGANYSVTAIPTQTISQLLVSNNTIVALAAGTAANILTIGGGTGTDLDVASGSQLNLSGTLAFSVVLATGATGSVAGSVTFAGTSGTPALKFLATDTSSLAFTTGSVFTCGPAFSSNPFGTGGAPYSLNAVQFQDGSTFVFKLGSNPFGAATPNSVVVFQNGSLYKQESSNSPAFSGRTYANFEYNYSGAVTVSGTGASSVNNLTITQGTLNYNMTSATITHSIKGNITVNGGTLNFAPAAVGTFVFNGGANQTISGSGTLTFNANANFNVNNGNKVILNKSIAIPGTFTVSSGSAIELGTSVISGVGSFTLASGAGLITANTDGITTSGNTGSIQTTTRSYSTGANYTYNGSGAQYTGNGLTTANNLTINNAAGVTLSNSITVNGILTQTAGTISGTQAVDGYVSITNNYIDIAESGSNMTAFALATTLNPANYPDRINRQWTITQSGASLNKDVTFYWDAADDGDYDWGVAEPAIWKGTTKYLVDTFNVSGASRWARVFSIPVTSTKDTYTIGRSDDAMLPVELSSFTATATAQNYVMLSWTTQSETNVSGYYIYRNNNTNLSTATKIPSLVQASNTSVETSYRYTDQEVQGNGTWYYWLQNVDLNGESNFHGPISVILTTNNNTTPPVIPVVTELRSIYPNPFNPTAIVSYNMAKAGNVTITVFNVKGEKVRNLVNESKSAGTFQVSWNGNDENGSSCTSGIYYVKMTAGKYTTTQKVVLAK